MDLLDYIKKAAGGAASDYAQLPNAYPNAQKFLKGLLSNIEEVAPPDPTNLEASKEFAINRAFDIPEGLLGTIRRASTSRLGEIGGQRPAELITKLEPGVKTGNRISTASPTKVEAEKIGFHQQPGFDITGEMMRTRPEAFNANMDLVSQYLPTRKRSPESKYNDFVDLLSGNLKAWIDYMPANYVERQRNWYKGANGLANDMSRAYDIPVEGASGVLARLSPGMDWNMNVEQADRLIDILKNHQKTKMPEGNPLAGTYLADMPDSESKAKWIRAFDEATADQDYRIVLPEGGLFGLDMSKSGKPKTIMWQSNDNLARAVDIAENPTVENISRNMGEGHKIRNFYNNISDPFHPTDVTIDTHAVSGALMKPYSQKGQPVENAFGGGAIKANPELGAPAIPGASKSGMASGTYGLYADAYRKAAQDLGWTAQELQSPVWSGVRSVFPGNGTAKAALQQQIDAEIYSLVKQGKITPDQAREMIFNAARERNKNPIMGWL